MKLQYLGTAAAEGCPSLFCDCETCRYARRARGKNLRSRSQALLEDRLLLDYPSDSLHHFYLNGIDTSKIRSALITHVHEDHFYPDDFGNLKTGFAAPPEGYVFTIYGSPDILEPLAFYVERAKGILRAVAVEPFKPFSVEGFTVTALKASHGTDHPYLYLVSDGEKTLLYAHDTGIFPDETFAYLEETKPKISLLSLDCTGGYVPSLNYTTHMCYGWDLEVRDRLAEKGLLEKDAKVVLNHFSHNGPKVNYDELAPLAEKDGLLVSYDGRIVEV